MKRVSDFWRLTDEETDEACATWLCSHTFSVGLILEPREDVL